MVVPQTQPYFFRRVADFDLVDLAAVDFFPAGRLAVVFLAVVCVFLDRLAVEHAALLPLQPDVVFFVAMSVGSC